MLPPSSRLQLKTSTCISGNLSMYIHVYNCITTTELLTTYSMMQDILWKADSHSPCQTIASFLYGNWRFITVFTKPCHQTLSWASRIHPFDPYLPKIQLNVIFPPTPRSSQWSLAFGPPNRNPVNTSPLPHACHMSRPSHPPWFSHPNNIRWRIQAVKFIIMQFSSRSVFLQFRSKYPQHSVLRKLSVYVPPTKWETKFCTHTVQLDLLFCIF
jgi:hypothetical protein